MFTMQTDRSSFAKRFAMAIAGFVAFLPLRAAACEPYEATVNGGCYIGDDAYFYNPCGLTIHTGGCGAQTCVFVDDGSNS